MFEPGVLTDEQKIFAVRALACFDPPTVVARALKEEFGVEITRQAVQHYDPTKAAGTTDARYVAMFAATREAFLKDTASIPLAHRSTRIRFLDRVARNAEARGNVKLAMEAVEQIAKECGNAFTNKREIEATGKDGSPLFEGFRVVLVDGPGEPPPVTPDGG